MPSAWIWGLLVEALEGAGTDSLRRELGGLDGDGFQLFAAVEGILADGLHLGAQRKGGQLHTFLERTCAEGSQSAYAYASSSLSKIVTNWSATSFCS